MMNKKDIIDFFDEQAARWDRDMIRKDRIIDCILDNAGVSEGKTVLDVACGTGVLFPDYLKRGVKCVTGIDISPKMAEIARNKCSADNITVLCADVEAFQPKELFDCVVVYNAFPHFPNPHALIEKLSALVKSGGTVTVAHGMSRKEIDSHHAGAASKISAGLMHEDELAQIFSKYLKVRIKISDDTMYQVTGIKK